MLQIGNQHAHNYETWRSTACGHKNRTWSESATFPNKSYKRKDFSCSTQNLSTSAEGRGICTPYFNSRTSPSSPHQPLKVNYFQTIFSIANLAYEDSIYRYANLTLSCRVDVTDFDLISSCEGLGFIGLTAIPVATEVDFLQRNLECISYLRLNFAMYCANFSVLFQWSLVLVDSEIVTSLRQMVIATEHPSAQSQKHWNTALPTTIYDLVLVKVQDK